MLSRAGVLATLDTRIREHTETGKTLGVLVVRILRLRELNILFGYEVGERLVEAVAQRMSSALRPVDRVLQAGDNEFVLMLPELLSANHALLAAHRVLRAFEQPLTVDGYDLLATVAIGVAIGPQHGDSADALCRRADIAFGEGLRSGEHVALFVPRESYLDVPYGELRNALGNGELQPHLQPIFEVRSGRLIGAESLARWHSPVLGTISPDIFVPLAEQTGLIGELTRWSMNATLRFAGLARLAERGMHFSINLSPRVFLQHDFGDQLLAALKIWDVPARALMLEITEGSVMEDPGRSATVLQRMRAAGMSIAIDDFGTGHSSLSYLKQFPADEVKLDRSFIRDIAHDERSARLLRAIIELAHRLEMRVVAEGVEDAATLHVLGEMGCDLAQGFHLGRAQPAEQFVAALPGI